MKSLKRIINSNRFLVLGDQGIYSATSFLSTLFFARLLSARDFGIYSTVILVNFLIISITNALIIQPFQVNVSSAENNRSYTSFCLAFQLLLTFLSVACLCLFSNISFFSELRPFILYVSLLSAGFILHDFFRKSFLAQAKTKKAFLVDSLLALSQFCAIGVLYYSELTELSGVLLYTGLAYLPAIFFSLLYAEFSFFNFKNWRQHIKMHVTQGSWLFLVAVLQWGSGNLFVLMSGVLIGIEALGALRLVQSLFGVLNVMLQTFENYVLPQATRLYTHSVSDSKVYLRSVTVKGAFAFGAVLLLLCIFSTSFISLAGGSKYAEYGYLVQGMSFLYFIIFIGYPIRMSVRMLILNRSFFIGYLLSFLFSFATYNFLIQRWHLGGVLAGLILNQLLMLLYWQYQLNKNKFYLWK
ncbi:hypothetical protein CNR22_22900 [Sphingobacteriaceae bacterium]|nr:hypothetical protein CNR22_22900 [Sphingobacteriaceae bacterium]